MNPSFSLGTMIFSQSSTLGRYEVMLHKLEGVIKKHEELLRFVDKGEEELVQLEENYKKRMEYWSRASKN